MTQVEKMIRDEEGQKYKKLMAEKDTQLEAKDAENARVIVQVVNNVALHSGGTLEDAYRATGITAEQYANASFLLSGKPLVRMNA